MYLSGLAALDERAFAVLSADPEAHLGAFPEDQNRLSFRS
jgi:hypothetical protein